MKKWLPPWTWAMLLVFAVGTIWLRLSIVRKSYSIDQLNKKITNARQELEERRLKVARLRSPRRLEKIARTKFNLQPPRSGQIIRLRQKK